MAAQFLRMSMLLGLLCPLAVSAAELVSLSGKVETLACTQSCGSCCGTHGLTDTSGSLSLQIGNSFVDLLQIADDDQVHQLTGRFYPTTGQCGVGQCTLFAVEAVDTPLAPAAVYQSANGKLSIQAVVIDDNAQAPYVVKLSPPYSIDSAIEHAALQVVPQGGDCSAPATTCASGTTCVAYFGVAGAMGPEFRTCETPCSHPGASCPVGQSCVTIADGPGAVCRVD